jgi:hypothetical protein
MKKVLPLLGGAAAGLAVYWAVKKGKITRDQVQDPLTALQVGAIAAALVTLVVL